MQSQGLIGLGKDSLDHSKSEIRQVFQVLADSREYPVMIHCTQGKDRTGLIVTLLLLLLETPLHIISADYVASERLLLSEKDARMHELKEMGLSEDFAGCPGTFVADMHDHIRKTYGSVQRYLQCIGVGQALQEKIKQNVREQQRQ